MLSGYDTIIRSDSSRSHFSDGVKPIAFYWPGCVVFDVLSIRYLGCTLVSNIFYLNIPILSSLQKNCSYSSSVHYTKAFQSLNGKVM